MRKLLLLPLLLLAACSDDSVEIIQEAKEHNPKYTLNDFEYAYSLDDVWIETGYGVSESTPMEKLITNDDYIKKVYGELKIVENNQQLKEYIKNQLTSFDMRIGILYKNEELPATFIEEIYKELMNSHNAISATLLWYTYGIEKVSDGYFIDLYNETTTNKIELATIEKEMDQYIEELQLDGLSDYEKVKKIYSFVIDRMDYVDGGLKKHHSSLGFVLDGEGVCQAYAVSMYMLFERAGIESRYIIGEIEPDYLPEGIDGAHAWNMVQLEGNWYHLDATWDDGKSEWEYFLVSDTFMSFSRNWEKEYYEVAEVPYEHPEV